MAPRHVSIALVVALAAAPVLTAQQRRVTETEPNDDAAHANVVQLGDTIVGTKIYQNSDYFAFDVPAGARLVIAVVERSFCLGIRLLDRDGQRGLQSKDCMYDARPHDTINVVIPTAGRYYVSVRHPEDIETPGSEGLVLPYKLRVALYTPPPPGPGNPMRLFTGDVNEVTAMVAAPDGDMVVVDRIVDAAGHEHFRLRRVTPDGHAATIATEFTPSGQIAVDAFGDVLMPSYDQAGVVWRYNLATGARTVFTGPSSGAFPYTGVTIGADGDVWLSEPGTSNGGTVSRFNALGVFKEKVQLPVRTFGLTTSQSGELFFIAQDSGDVYKLVNNTTPQRVIAAPSFGKGYGNRFQGTGTVALDQDGWLYVNQPYQGKLLLFNAQYQLARDPLAQVLDSLHWVEKHISDAGPVWMRDANGMMTSRMLEGRGPGFYQEIYGSGEILEVNHAGMGAPGADPGLHVDRTPLRSGAVLVAYADTLRLAAAGSAQWSFIAGQLPTGVTLAPNGVLSGTPSTNGTFEFSVKAANGPRAGFGRFSITVGDAVQVSVNDITNALMGGPSLSAAQAQYLDSIGNRNGQLDVGDLRAYLRAQGQLSGGRQP